MDPVAADKTESLVRPDSRDLRETRAAPDNGARPGARELPGGEERQAPLGRLDAAAGRGRREAEGVRAEREEQVRVIPREVTGIGLYVCLPHTLCIVIRLETDLSNRVTLSQSQDT